MKRYHILDEDNPRGLRFAGIILTTLILLACASSKNLEEGPAMASSRSAPNPIQERQAELTRTQSRGKAIYQHYCSVCHGVEGRGDGFNAWNLDPRPINHADAELMKGWTDERLFKVISEGGAAVGRSALMPPWGGVMKEDQIRKVIAYIRLLGQAEGGKATDLSTD